MKILVLLVLFPVMNHGSLAPYAPCEKDLAQLDVSNEVCFIAAIGGQKAKAELDAAYDKAVQEKNDMKIKRFGEIGCCMLRNSYVCIMDWYKRCKGQNVENQIPEQMTLADDKGAPYNCKKPRDEYPLGKCGVAERSSSLLLVLSAVALVIFSSL